jgi:hypothetical protein
MSEQEWTFVGRHVYRRADGTAVFQRPRFRLPDGSKVCWYEYAYGPGWAHGADRADTMYFKGKYNCSYGCCRPDEMLYHLNELVPALSTAPVIYWTEGETDCNAIRDQFYTDELGVRVAATSHHQAAGNSTVAQAELFRGYQGTVVLLYDLDPDDKNGGNIGAYDVLKRFDLLRSVGLRRIAIAHSPVGKDIRDGLEAGCSLSDLVFLGLPELIGLRGKAARIRHKSLYQYRQNVGKIIRELREGWANAEASSGA